MQEILTMIFISVALADLIYNMALTKQYKKLAAAKDRLHKATAEQNKALKELVDALNRQNTIQESQNAKLKESLCKVVDCFSEITGIKPNTEMDQNNDRTTQMEAETT